MRRAAHARSVSVLVVEGNNRFAQMIRSGLEHSDLAVFHVRQAHSLHEAVQALLTATSDPDVILLDPQLSLTRVRRYAPDTPVIVLDSQGAPGIARTITRTLDRREGSSSMVARVRAAMHMEGARWKYADRRVFALLCLILALCLGLAVLMTLPALAEDSPLSLIKDAYEARQAAMERQLEMMKWAAVGIIGALTAAIGLLYRALTQQQAERIAQMTEHANQGEARSERMAVALTEATAAMTAAATAQAELTEQVRMLAVQHPLALQPPPPGGKRA